MNNIEIAKYKAEGMRQLARDLLEMIEIGEITTLEEMEDLLIHVDGMVRSAFREKYGET